MTAWVLLLDAETISVDTNCLAIVGELLVKLAVRQFCDNFGTRTAALAAIAFAKLCTTRPRSAAAGWVGGCTICPRQRGIRDGGRIRQSCIWLQTRIQRGSVFHSREPVRWNRVHREVDCVSSRVVGHAGRTRTSRDANRAQVQRILGWQSVQQSSVEGRGGASSIRIPEKNNKADNITRIAGRRTLRHRQRIKIWFANCHVGTVAGRLECLERH